MESLTIGSVNKKEKFSYIRDLSKIERLWLLQSSAIESLDELQITASLKVLGLRGFTGLKKLNLPNSLNNLSYISLDNCPEITDIAPFGKLTYLERIEFKMCGKLTSIAPLTECPNLQEIHIKHCRNLREIPDSLKNKIVSRFSL